MTFGALLALVTHLALTSAPSEPTPIRAMPIRAGDVAAFDGYLLSRDVAVACVSCLRTEDRARTDADAAEVQSGCPTWPYWAVATATALVVGGVTGGVIAWRAR